MVNGDQTMLQSYSDDAGEQESADNFLFLYKVGVKSSRKQSCEAEMEWPPKLQAQALLEKKKGKEKDTSLEPKSETKEGSFVCN